MWFLLVKMTYSDIQNPMDPRIKIKITTKCGFLNNGDRENKSFDYMNFSLWFFIWFCFWFLR